MHNYMKCVQQSRWKSQVNEPEVAMLALVEQRQKSLMGILMCYLYLCL